jgi:hypothetical protein
MLNFLKSKEKKKQEVRQTIYGLKALEEADEEFLNFIKQSDGDTVDMEKYFKDMEEKYYEPFLCWFNRKDFRIRDVEDYPKDEFEEYEPYVPEIDSTDYFFENVFYPDYFTELAALWQSTMSMDIAIYYLCKKIKEADDPEQFVKENHNLIRLTAMQVRSDAVPRYEHLMRAFALILYGADYYNHLSPYLNHMSLIPDRYLYHKDIPICSVVTTPDGIDRAISPIVPDGIYKYHAENKYNREGWMKDDHNTFIDLLDKVEMSVLEALTATRASELTQQKLANLIDKDISLDFLNDFLNAPSLFNFQKHDSIGQYTDNYDSDRDKDMKDAKTIYKSKAIILENVLYDFYILVTPERYNSDTDENNMTEKEIKEVTKGLLKIYDTLVEYWSKFPEYKE